MEVDLNTSDPHHLRPLWEAILEVYREYASVCDRYHLRYYVCAGSLLGAVRHGGFIPWDDDFDVVMPRPDYEKFKEIAARELPSHLKWVDRHNTPEFALMFGKIQDCRRANVESVERSLGYMQAAGIFIDIYPIDGYPDSRLMEKWLKLKEKLAYLAYYFSTRSKGNGRRTLTLKWRISYVIGALAAPFFPSLDTDSKFRDWTEQYLRGLPYDDRHRTGTGGCLVGKFQRILEPGWLGAAKEMKFENITIKVPSQTDALLRSFYGDYMKLPPPELRTSTHLADTRLAWWLGPTQSSS